MPRKPSYDRDALIAQARDIFWRQGWAGTSLKDLENELKLKPGSFYAAFGSKDALYALALERYAQDGVARLTALADALGAKEALKMQPRLVIEATEMPAKACMLAKTYVELRAKDHDLAAKAGEFLVEMKTCFAGLFRRAQEVGEISPDHDADRLAMRYQSDLLGLRLSAERSDVDARAIAADIAADIDRL
ncbi:TetR/AcrR family transcriptional regulator [Rhodobacteraceae bacterium B1Z28]|uniref:TetR/AcrR family transcriptional regulator n=1 Tax=Ruegeria haliotis TaxID=2747601 RepID=A0ABX2PV10_9RHOB|nr:TetR/AcrR family transcriptional regulator [Ruegeria haliotis]NVO56869.1 TetR/AcrR family transcriptional regulator [Ruegeria haliotis]